MQFSYPQEVERWSVFEASFSASYDGNPFKDDLVAAEFSGKHETVTAAGFYDGGDTFRVRFMPSFTGDYSFKISASACGEALEGKFSVTEASARNHGMVRARGYHFEYDDGTPFYPMGTTCYVWELQDLATRTETLRTLQEGYFNKIRFCVFPKHYLYNFHEPVSYPYEGTPCRFEPKASANDFDQMMSVQPGNDWDFSRFNPGHFQNIENAVAALGALGIETDLILLHPYDRWGFSQMSAEDDNRYLRYITARLSAYRNVWWSLANEYDLLRHKSVADWERMAKTIVDFDPYRHLRSIHNCVAMYDHSRPWITHCSIQRQDVYKCAEYTDEFRVRYGKPVVLDEIGYEGDIEYGWGNLGGQELVRRFWEAAIRGGYATHGETYDRGDNRLWWSHGGRLYGESPARIKFLRQILGETPGAGLKRIESAWDDICATAEGANSGGYRIYYYGFNRPCRRMFTLDESVRYRVEIIDTWDMTLCDAGIHSGTFTIELPRKPYMAIRILALS